MSEATAVRTTEKKVKKKGKKSKKALRVLGIIFGVIVLAGSVCALITAIGNNSNLSFVNSIPAVKYEKQLVPEKDASGWYVFTTDNDLKVLQLTDVHLGGGFMSINKDKMSLNCVASMVTAEKPDLVMVTGDVAYPVPFQAGTFNNKNGAHLFAELMEKLGVYWTVCYGNHDTEAYSYYSREDISEMYKTYPHCLIITDDGGVYGVGNQIIKVKDSAGAVRKAFVVFDSNAYTDKDYFGIFWKYDNIHEDQINWYKQELDKINADNAALGVTEKTGSFAFFHIPCEEYRTAWNEYTANNRQDTADVKYFYGDVHEKDPFVYCGLYENQLFETFLEYGTQAVFCGHDHYNNFSLEYKGIRLTYGKSVDYLAYSGISKLGAQRGCTVIELHPDAAFDIKAESYYKDKYISVSELAKEEVTMQWELK